MVAPGLRIDETVRAIAGDDAVAYVQLRRSLLRFPLMTGLWLALALEGDVVQGHISPIGRKCLVIAIVLYISVVAASCGFPRHCRAWRFAMLTLCMSRSFACARIADPRW